MIKKVGFIGLGIMGMPMARNLLKAGFEVVAYNRTMSKAEALAKEGAQKTSSPQELAKECPVVITIVSDTPDVEEVLLGKGDPASMLHAIIWQIRLPRVLLAALVQHTGCHDAPPDHHDHGRVLPTASAQATNALHMRSTDHTNEMPFRPYSEYHRQPHRS